MGGASLPLDEVDQVESGKIEVTDPDHSGKARIRRQGQRIAATMKMESYYSSRTRSESRTTKNANHGTRSPGCGRHSSPTYYRPLLRSDRANADHSGSLVDDGRPRSGQLSVRHVQD